MYGRPSQEVTTLEILLPGCEKFYEVVRDAPNFDDISQCGALFQVNVAERLSANVEFSRSEE